MGSITKVCKTCKIELSIDKFYTAGKYKGKTQYRSECKKCHCKTNFERYLSKRPNCIDCGGPVHSLKGSGLCKRCVFKKSRSKRWKGGKKLDKSGYTLLHHPGHPDASNNYIREHRFVMEQKIGRYLLKHENVHHKNGNRSDNELSNLELWSTFQPSGQRIEDKVDYAITILNLYKAEALHDEYKKTN
jgi:hypothetical protein